MVLFWWLVGGGKGGVYLHNGAAPWAAGDDRMRSEPKAVRAACRAAVRIEVRSRWTVWPRPSRVRRGALAASGESDMFDVAEVN